MVRVNPKYTIERRLGGGGMAEVFSARSEGAEGFTRRVAIKRVLPGFSENASFARMFVSEAQICSRLQHQNIVSVVDLDRDVHGRLFLVMELVDGVNLDGLLDTGPLSFPLVIYLAIEILSGLSYAHDLPVQAEDRVRGIVHRDMSPHNVLLSWEGAVKISDFGIAKSRATSNVPGSGTVKGKPAYLSPEQANGKPLDGRSDLFSVGVMLWEMLCLGPLFRGATPQETIGRMLFAPISSPSEVRPGVPEDLSRVVLGLLARDRAQRTPNAAAAINELVACADHARNGRGVLIETLADRFAARVVVDVPDVPVEDAQPLAPAPVLTRAGGLAPASPDPAAGELRTLTQLPGVVLDPVAPPVRRRRRTRQRTWFVVTVLAITGSLVGAGLSLSARRLSSVSRATGSGSMNHLDAPPDARPDSPSINEACTRPGAGRAQAAAGSQSQPSRAHDCGDR